ncbi:hypothetical protein [Pelagicoccus sp. SDUM812005]|uniref:hypothetical protein n=1 Tax=Pelagicoccus sp. SDUM812005 TaxID=3041257 RepID=UPI00280DB73D|nr:hypothetical protein [Pelagicoccus sp. SDUM812005]MDQ8182312.1 hypothetical protein [Pelagicoccus sp. SDUM812005]
MISAVDQYLKTLLTFVPRNAANRFTKDYIALIHVPAVGPEKVYSLVLDENQPLLTVAAYKSAVWEVVETLGSDGASKPELDALQAQVDRKHPALDYLDSRTLSSCENYSDGRAGLDYYLMLWQRDGESGVVECYEPYSREDYSWSNVIGAMQVLSSQFEYAIK